MNFRTSSADADLILAIARRAIGIAEGLGVKLDTLHLTMDVTACHANGCPLDLQALLDSNKMDFTHDIFGIRRHIDRGTGKLLDCFVPRFALRLSATV